MTPDLLRSTLLRYKSVRDDYQLLARCLQTKLAAIADRLGIHPLIMGRAKTVESLAEKLERPGRTSGADPLATLTDLCGVRVVTHTLDQVERVREEVAKELLVEPGSHEDKGKTLLAREFGYLSNHFIVKLRETPEIPGVPLARREGLTRLCAELQVRTLAQHLWADVYHETGYKNEFRLPDRMEREFARIAAQLENCDNDFQAIATAMRSYESSYGNYMSQDDLRALRASLEVLAEVEPGNARVLHRLIRVHLALEDGEAGIRSILETHLGVLERHAPALRDLGVALCRTHAPASPEFARGQELLQRATAADARDVDALCSLGGTYRRQGRREDALACYRRAHHLDPSDPYALGNFVAEEMLRTESTEVLDYFQPLIDGAIERCRQQVAVGVNLPWACYDLGIFHVYKGKPLDGLCFYARGVEAAARAWMIESALSTLESFSAAARPGTSTPWTRIESALGRLESFSERGIALEGVAMIERFLRLALRRRRGARAAQGPGEPASAAGGPFRAPVLVVAGGCGGLAGSLERELARLESALAGYRGTIVSGGTRSGIAGLVGEVQEAAPPGAVETVGYVPSDAMPGLREQLDGRYTRIRHSDGLDFSPLEPLLFWEEFMAAGGDPKTVKLLGFNGGAITACEFRIARALGARVGIVKGSGRAADAFLGDPLWQEPERPVGLDLERGGVERFLAG